MKTSEDGKVEGIKFNISGNGVNETVTTGKNGTVDLDLLPGTYTVGLWNGRRMGYKEIPSGNIRDCLSGGYDYTTWYVDKKGDFRCDDIHHDGINHYLYRVYKDGVSEYQKDRLKEKLYEGTATRSDVTRITRRLGDEIGKVYPLRRQHTAGARCRSWKDL